MTTVTTTKQLPARILNALNDIIAIKRDLEPLEAELAKLRDRAFTEFQKHNIQKTEHDGYVFSVSKESVRRSIKRELLLANNVPVKVIDASTKESVLKAHLTVRKAGEKGWDEE